MVKHRVRCGKGDGDQVPTRRSLLTGSCRSRLSRSASPMSRPAGHPADESAARPTPCGGRLWYAARKRETVVAKVIKASPGGNANFEINPMDQSEATRLQRLRQAPRCGARTRSGTPCRRPAIRGRKRCRLHGGLSPGAPRGEKNGNFKTGDWTLDAIEERKWLRSLCDRFAKARNEENQ